jgi:outer membrane murein-binding lipoprotein Lpp
LGYPDAVRTSTAVVAAVSILVALSGCSSAHDEAAEQAVEQLHASLRADDGAAACDQLSEDVQKELTQSEGSCATAVMEAGIPDGGRVRDVRVYGTTAQVRYDEDVVFLAEFPDGWKVTAAGCSAEAGAPYDCQVQGG